MNSLSQLERLCALQQNIKDPLLQVENLKVSFSLFGQELQVLRGISFSVFASEAVGIVGESGSGKSTAVQAITRLSEASSIAGKIWFDGQDLSSCTEKQLREVRGKQIGMVFQDPFASLNPTLRIASQIEEGLLYHNMASPQEARAKALELLQLVGIPDPLLCLKQYPHQLSGGQRQRVLIAIALACNPKLLIADEPTSALDVTVQAQILKLLKRLQRHFQMSLLLITHDFRVVAQVCDRILVFYAGKIVEQGTVQEVLSHPKHPYTQMLLHAIPSFHTPHKKGPS